MDTHARYVINCWHNTNNFSRICEDLEEERTVDDMIDEVSEKEN